LIEHGFSAISFQIAKTGKFQTETKHHLKTTGFNRNPIFDPKSKIPKVAA